MLFLLLAWTEVVVVYVDEQRRLVFDLPVPEARHYRIP